MHGRPRPVKGVPEDPDKLKAAKQRVVLYGTLTKEVVRRKAAQQFDEESLNLAAKLLEQNPEVYTVWNYRRGALKDILDGAEGEEAAEKAARGELALTETALRKNPKSYSTWHYRRWIVSKKLTPLEHELELIGKLLEVDERNFHAWGYRHFVVQLMGRREEEEEAYTRQRIDANFSNYSAWHTRSALLQKMYGSHRTITLSALVQETAQPPLSGVPAVPTWVLKEELELLEQAFFTDPEDQSCWLYHRWLLGNALVLLTSTRGTEQEAATFAEVREMVEKEVGKCDNLLEVEPDRGKCKWALLTKARLRELQVELGGDAASLSAWRHDIKELYQELAQVDPMRQGYYQDCLEGTAHVALKAAVEAS